MVIFMVYALKWNRWNEIRHDNCSNYRLSRRVCSAAFEAAKINLSPEHCGRPSVLNGPASRWKSTLTHHQRSFVHHFQSPVRIDFHMYVFFGDKEPTGGDELEIAPNATDNTISIMSTTTRWGIFHTKHRKLTHTLKNENCFESVNLKITREIENCISF